MKHKHISLINNNSFKGYRFTVTCGHKLTQVWFSFSKYGDNALQAAIDHRDKVLPELFGIDFMHRTKRTPNQFLSKNNTSGHIGVSVSNHNTHGLQIVASYQVTTEDGKRKSIQKQFSVNKYGYDEAIKLAVEAREQGLRNSYD